MMSSAAFMASTNKTKPKPSPDFLVGTQPLNRKAGRSGRRKRKRRRAEMRRVLNAQIAEHAERSTEMRIPFLTDLPVLLDLLVKSAAARSDLRVLCDLPVKWIEIARIRCGPFAIFCSRSQPLCLGAVYGAAFF
jgi:hypothetical protein